MGIVRWLSENGREPNTFAFTLAFLVVSPRHVHSCFVKQVLML